MRSTFIVGFPGETDADFEQLLQFLEQAQLDRVGCFQYSPVEGATANALPDPVPDDVKQARWERFMETQQVISSERLALKVGKEIDVIIDEVNDEGLIGRSSADAPEIDGLVYLALAEGVNVGDVVRARIDDSDEYDLYGELVR